MPSTSASLPESEPAPAVTEPPATAETAAPASTPPSDPRYIAREGAPITVLRNAEADALFERPDTCTNQEVGYSVTFPDDWYTNTRVDDIPACSWFTPEFFEVPPGRTPEEVWISIGLVEGVAGYTSLTDMHFSEELVIDGHRGHRVEFTPDPNTDPDVLIYQYVLPFEEFGPTLVAATTIDMADDYELGKAVLDRVMASLVFE